MNYTKLIKDMKIDKKLQFKKPCNHPIIFVLEEIVDENHLNMHYDCVCLNCKERKFVKASDCHDLGVVDPNNPAISHVNSIEEYQYAKKRYDELKTKIPFNKIAITIEQELVKRKENELTKAKR
jgi:hypothetical protein